MMAFGHASERVMDICIFKRLNIMKYFSAKMVFLL
jgi:hypothetical protein